MGNLAAALSAHENGKPKGPRCTIGILLNELDDIDRKALTKALESHMTGESIGQALRDEGHPVSGPTIQRHRRKQCSCGTR